MSVREVAAWLRARAERKDDTVSPGGAWTALALTTAADDLVADDVAEDWPTTDAASGGAE